MRSTEDVVNLEPPAKSMTGSDLAPQQHDGLATVPGEPHAAGRPRSVLAPVFVANHHHSSIA